MNNDEQDKKNNDRGQNRTGKGARPTEKSVPKSGKLRTPADLFGEVRPEARYNGGDGGDDPPETEETKH